MKGPVEHIERAMVPWRDERLTECGLLVADVAACIDRPAAVAKAKELGMQRYAMVACMTCVQTVNRHGTWETDPVGVLERSLSRYGPNAELSARELRAIALLIAAHTDEFQETLAALADAPSLAERRTARRMRR